MRERKPCMSFFKWWYTLEAEILASELTNFIIATLVSPPYKMYKNENGYFWNKLPRQVAIMAKINVNEYILSWRQGVYIFADKLLKIQ